MRGAPTKADKGRRLLGGRMRATVWFDGACSGNPGPMGAGAVVESAQGRCVLSEPVGRGTNNQAEYHGLLLGLRAARALGAEDVHVHGDSQLVLRQLEGRYKVRNPGLRPLWQEAMDVLAGFRAYELEWVPRDENAAADEAARRAIA